MFEFPEFVGSIDHKLCPSCPNLLGCVYEGDVWVLDAKTGKKHQLTKTAGHQTMHVFDVYVLWNTLHYHRTKLVAIIMLE